MAPKSPSNASNWQAELFRATVFLAPGIDPDAEGWWTKLTGTKSETKNVRPGKGVFLEAGPFGANLLTLSVQPGRIDWILGPGPLTEDQTSSGEAMIRSAGEFVETEPVFSRLIASWLSDCPPIIRLGYGAVLLERTASRESGYSRIAQYLPNVTIDPAGSEDFFYQINRPRISGSVAGLRLNRLSKWSVAAIQPVSFSMSLVQGPSQPVIYAHGGNPATACRLELDLSTPAEIREPLQRESLHGILDELMKMGHEIAERGDVP